MIRSTHRSTAMSLKDLFAELTKDREAMRRRERHGRGDLTFLDGMPVSAIACALPDGTLTDAECLLPRAAVSTEAQRVWTRRLPGTALRRRGRLKVDCGKALIRYGRNDRDGVRADEKPDRLP
jgi:hypothetical protein